MNLDIAREVPTFISSVLRPDQAHIRAQFDGPKNGKAFAVYSSPAGSFKPKRGNL
jgi:hypothetical protein